MAVVVVHSSGHCSVGDGNSLSLVGLGQTVVDQVVNTIGTSGEVPAVVEGAFSDERRVAGRSLTASSGAVCGSEEVLVELGVLGGQVVVVLAEVEPPGW